MAQERTIRLNLTGGLSRTEYYRASFERNVNFTLGALLDFQAEAMALLGKHADAKELLLFLQTVPNWPHDPFESGRLVGPVNETHLAAFADDLQSLLSGWGLQSWPMGRRVVVGLLRGIAAGTNVSGYMVTLSDCRVQSIHLRIEAEYAHNNSQAILERRIVTEVRKELRKQYKENGSRAQQPGKEPGRDVTERNLTWYFLHKHGKSYSEVIALWNQDHPTQKLDTTNESDVSKVKKGIHDVGVKLGVKLGDT
jgi:hypothetical protein